MSKYAINRNRVVENFIHSAFALDNVAGRNTPFRLLEFGAGRGEFIDRFRGIANVETIASDLDPLYLAALATRHTVAEGIESLPAPVDGIFAIDVLEHIEDDRAALAMMHRALTPNGKILIYVPARMELYSPFDKAIGHFRRYDVADLRTKALEAGFHIETARYHDFLGYFAAYYNKLFTSDDAAGLNPRAVEIYDRYLVPTSEGIERIIRRPPIGKNVLLVASKVAP